MSAKRICHTSDLSEPMPLVGYGIFKSPEECPQKCEKTHWRHWGMTVQNFILIGSLLARNP